MTLKLLHIPSGLYYINDLHESMKHKDMRQVLTDLANEYYQGRYYPACIMRSIGFDKCSNFFRLYESVYDSDNVKDYEFEIVEVDEDV